jgi:hypothetical protein
MNRKIREQEKLLAETFHGEWSAEPMASFARQAAATVRRRRQLKQTFLAMGAVAGFAIAALISLPRGRAPTRMASAPTAPAPAYEVISDEELLAQLRDQPLLVMNKPNGTREFVILEN